MEELGEPCCEGTGPLLSWVMAVIAMEQDTTVCGRSVARVGELFVFFTRGVTGPSRLDACTFVRDGRDCWRVFVEAVGSCVVCDFTGQGFAGAGFCSRRSGTTAGVALWSKISDEKSVDSKKHTGFLSFFDDCEGLGVEVFGDDSAGGFVVFGVGFRGCLVDGGPVFCRAG